MKTLISRLTMKKNGEVHKIKRFSPDCDRWEDIYTYVDKYGDKYEAFSPFYICSWRRKKVTIK
jgi:hypothetical protein